MDTVSLIYFSEAAKDLNFTKTAQRLFISQQTLSNHIARLEETYQVKLFERKPRLMLTSAGETLLSFARDYKTSEENLKAQLTDISQRESAQLRIGCTPHRTSIVMPILAEEFARRYPNVELDFYVYHSTDLVEMLVNGELDIALANLNQDDPESFQSVCIGRDHFVIVVDPAHPLAKRDSVALEDLAATPLVMYNTDSVQNNAILSRFESLGITPYIQIYTSQIYTMKGMIHNSTCASFFYASLLEDHPDLVGIPIEPRIEQKVGLLWRKSKYTPSGVESFISFVRDYPLFPEEP